MNAWEKQAVAQYESKGWNVLTSGWPDLLMFRTCGNLPEIRAVELKRNFNGRVQPNQHAALCVLGAIMPIFVGIGKEGYSDFEYPHGEWMEHPRESVLSPNSPERIKTFLDAIKNG